MNANANGPRYFLSYSGVSLPLRLVSPLAASELQNRNTYFRAVYDEADNSSPAKNSSTARSS